MKQKVLVIVAILAALLLGVLLGRNSAPDPGPDPDPNAGLRLDPDSKPGCVKVSVEKGSQATFLVVEVLDGERTGRTLFVADKDRQREKEICSEVPPQASGMATSAAAQSDPPDPHVKVFSLGKSAECKDGFCTDNFEDYPHPWPPGS